MNEKKEIKKFSRWFKLTFIPKLLQLPNTTHLGVMRDGLGLLLPLTIVGSIGTLAVTFIFGGWGGTSTSILGWVASIFDGVNKLEGGNWSFVQGSAWEQISIVGTQIFGPLKAFTLDSFALYASFLLSYMIGRIRKIKEPAFAAVIGLGAFLIVTRAEKFYFDGTGVFLAMVISMIAGEMFCWIINSNKFRIKISGNIPDAIVKGFDSMLPVLIVLSSVCMLDASAWAISNYSGIDVMTTEAKIDPETNVVSLAEVVKFEAGEFGFGGLFIQLISGPMLNMVAGGNVGLGIALFYTFGIGIFWVFGIHGSNMMNIVFWPIFVALVQVNLNLRTMGIPSSDSAYVIWNAGTFDSFIIITGGGITGALVLGMLIFGNDFLVEKKIAKIAAPAQMFNINEPVTFGFPIMFNPKWAIPFVLTMPIACITTYFAFTLNLVKPAFIVVPWTLPLGLAGLLSTGMDPWAFILAWFNFGCAFLIYFPFIIISNRLAIKKLKKDGIYEQEKLRIKQEKLLIKKEKFERKLLRLEEKKYG